MEEITISQFLKTLTIGRLILNGAIWTVTTACFMVFLRGILWVWGIKLKRGGWVILLALVSSFTAMVTVGSLLINVRFAW